MFLVLTSHYKQNVYFIVNVIFYHFFYLFLSFYKVKVILFRILNILISYHYLVNFL